MARESKTNRWTDRTMQTYGWTGQDRDRQNKQGNHIDRQSKTNRWTNGARKRQTDKTNTQSDTARQTNGQTFDAETKLNMEMFVLLPNLAIRKFCFNKPLPWQLCGYKTGRKQQLMVRVCLMLFLRP